jgi:signal transduction histidine kinase
MGLIASVAIGLAACLACVAAMAAAAPERTLALPSENLANAVWLFEDPDGALTLEQVLSPSTQSRFVPWDATRGDVNLGFSASAWWIRVRLQRSAAAPSAWVLDIPYAYNRLIDFHAPGRPVVQTGHGRPLENRPVLSQHFAFPVAVSDSPQDFYFRVASNYAVSVPLRAWHQPAYARNALHERLLQALYHGALLAMILHACFIGVSLRDARFGLYALYGTMLSLGMLTGNGWGSILFWPGQTEFDGVSPGIFLSLSVTTLLLFVRTILKTRHTLPRWGDGIIVGTAVLAAICAGLMFLSAGRGDWTAALFQCLFALGLLGVTLVSIAAWKVRTLALPGTGFFMLSWSVLGVGVLVATLRVVGWVPSTTLTHYAVQIATAIEMLLLAFMLASIVRQERRVRLALQQTMIEDLRSQEQRLEQSVEARTRALADAADRERRTLAEYLRFAALVSHEFRNGLNVISAQSDVLHKQATDLRIAERTQVIRSHVARLAQLTNTWLKSDQLLNTPAPPERERIDCAAWFAQFISKQPDGFDGHEIRWNIAPDATTIWADPNLLDVVLMNLLTNACKYSPARTSIEVGTCAKTAPGGTRMVGLRVSDQGVGIEPTLQPRVFDRYFRIQPEGPVSGIGLGLSLVRHIAEQHQGEVDLVSEPGRGSIFTVWFPDTASASSL